jgi:hypothetical protein
MRRMEPLLKLRLSSQIVKGTDAAVGKSCKKGSRLRDMRESNALGAFRLRRYANASLFASL